MRSPPARSNAGAAPTAVAVPAAVAVLAAVALAALAAGGAVAATDAGHSADPTVDAPGEVERTEALTATVSRPESATDARTLEVRLDPVSGSTVATRTVTLAPGESRTVDFGACRPAGAYAVRVTTTGGDVLAATQTTVAESPDAVAIAEDRDGSTVRPNGTYALDLAFDGCRDRARVSVDRDGEDVWTAVVADADGDGEAGVRWDVDAPAGDALAATDGDDVIETEARNRTATYGEYGVEVLVDGEPVDRERLAVSFADPTASVYRVRDADSADDALAQARDGTVPAERYSQVVAGDWVVLRFDTDGTLTDLPREQRLVHPARYGNATVRVEPYGYQGDVKDLDLANATRVFDADTDAVWYAVRPTDDAADAVVRYVAIGDGWNATAEARVDVDPRARLASPGRGLLAPAEGVLVEGWSGYPNGTEVTVALRDGDRTLVRETATVRGSEFAATLDLSTVPNGTNATLVVTRDGDRLDARNVTVASRPALSLRGVAPTEEPVAGDPLAVQVGLVNDGTVLANETVTVALGDRTRNVTVSVPPGEYAEVDVAFDAVPDRYRVNLSASVAGETRSRTVDVTNAAEPATTRRTPTTTGTEPWPTLAGSDRSSADGPLPGFGVPTAVLTAVAALLVAHRRRARGE